MSEYFQLQFIENLAQIKLRKGNAQFIKLKEIRIAGTRVQIM